MDFRTIAAVLLGFSILSACGGQGDNPLGRENPTEEPDDGEDGEEDPVVPVDDPEDPLVNEGSTDDFYSIEDVDKITLDSDDDGNPILVVEGLTLDGGGAETVYVRRTDLDQSGFLAFAIQDDPLDRYVRGYIDADNNGGTVTAGVAVSGAQFNRYFRGATVTRTDDYDPPAATDATGLVTYTGNYVGVLNIEGTDSELLPVIDAADEIIPGTVVLTTTGKVFLNADFADLAINGSVYDREAVEIGLSLPSYALILGRIDDEGNFGGTMEFSNDQTVDAYEALDQTEGGVGQYAGIIGGEDGAAIAGALTIDSIDGGDDILGFTNEEEIGVFTLEKCGTDGANAARCAEVNPDFSAD
ncbi:hypothetical protein [Litorisediminicola beolgyonensis]|uniref:Thymidylate synthase n=1 Tax=Litorisediminicola beolgyonensis TaxID=1173614 RepID=A0ABW3ZMN6_9RHOB